MMCEMCGSETQLVTAQIEGVELLVCNNCARHGKIITKKIIRKNTKKPIKTPPKKEIIQQIKSDFSSQIKAKRESMGMKQSEFAKYLAERESLVHKMESGTYTPSIELARKLEKQLSLHLIETQEIEPQNIKAKKTTFTIGDMIKVK